MGKRSFQEYVNDLNDLEQQEAILLQEQQEIDLNLE